MDFYVTPPAVVDGQLVSAGQMTAYYSRNVSLLWDMARGRRCPMRTAMGEWAERSPWGVPVPYPASADDEGGYAFLYGRLRHRFNLFYVEVIATWNWSLASRPRCQVLYGETVVADLADEMPGVGGGTYTVTLSMLANLTPFGLELWRAYPVTLRYSPPFGDQELWQDPPGGMELVRWYEVSA